jgi:hypothetical protein
MIDEALTEPAAIDLAKGFKALGDPSDCACCRDRRPRRRGGVCL